MFLNHDVQKAQQAARSGQGFDSHLHSVPGAYTAYHQERQRIVAGKPALSPDAMKFRSAGRRSSEPYGWHALLAIPYFLLMGCSALLYGAFIYALIVGHADLISGSLIPAGQARVVGWLLVCAIIAGSIAHILTARMLETHKITGRCWRVPDIGEIFSGGFRAIIHVGTVLLAPVFLAAAMASGSMVAAGIATAVYLLVSAAAVYLLPAGKTYGAGLLMLSGGVGLLAGALM